jgi:hypothetical protein
MDLRAVCGPLPSHPRIDLLLGGSSALPAGGGVRPSHSCRSRRAVWDHCVTDWFSQAPPHDDSPADVWRPGLHCRSGLVRRQAAFASLRSGDHHGRQCSHDLCSSSESHLLQILRVFVSLLNPRCPTQTLSSRPLRKDPHFHPPPIPPLAVRAAPPCAQHRRPRRTACAQHAFAILLTLPPARATLISL